MSFGEATKLTSSISEIETPIKLSSSSIEFKISGDSAETIILALLISDLRFPISNSNISKSPPLSIMISIVLGRVRESMI